MSKILGVDFYKRDVLEVAHELIGKRILIRKDNEVFDYIIVESEAYRGTGDLACHASKGKTPRTAPMFEEGGILYIYLVYGIHWMLNIVTSVENDPQAVLIRGLHSVKGPGRLTKKLGINGELNRQSVLEQGKIWLEEGYQARRIQQTPRIGIDYAGEPWVSKKWRFVTEEFDGL